MYQIKQNLGFGTFCRGILIITAFNYRIYLFDFFLCSFLIPIPFSSCFRLAQVIALIIAIDRLIAIWKPIFYIKQHVQVREKGPIFPFYPSEKKIVLFVGLVCIVSYGFFISVIFYNVDTKSPLSLVECLSPVSDYWYFIMPCVSGVLSIVFFAVYTTSLVIFCKHTSFTKKQTTPYQSSFSKMQRRMFITVSLALFSMITFYVFPTILQFLCYYFNITGWVYNASKMIIHYGEEFNGCLTALIYLTKHKEFHDCSKHLVFRWFGTRKITTIENSQNTKVIKSVHRSNASK